jgi:hypothetical protein
MATTLPALSLSLFHLLHPSSTCNAPWQSALVLHPSPKSRTEEEGKGYLNRTRII